MSASPPEYTEEELRALEAEMERVTIDDVLLQTVVSLLNLTARKAGLTGSDPTQPGPEPDWPQVRQGIDGVGALLPLLEARHAQELGPIKDALSRLQMHFAQSAPAGQAGPGDAPPAQAPPGRPAPPQRPEPQAPPSRLWIPGQ